jgi:Tfp pilus assembly protein PilV
VVAASSSRRARGFTILEVIVAAFLTAIAVTGLLSVLGNVSNAQARVYKSERMERAADEKLNELIATGDITVDGNGTFDDVDNADLSWSSTYEDTGTDNLAHVQVIVTKGTDTATADRLLFVKPAAEEDPEAAPAGGAAP